MGKIIWSTEADFTLKDIFDYIALDNPTAAEKTIEGIFNKVELLRENPLIGHIFEGKNKNIRTLLFGHYRIAYRVEDNGDIGIAGIYHGALDLPKKLD